MNCKSCETKNIIDPISEFSLMNDEGHTIHGPYNRCPDLGLSRKNLEYKLEIYSFR
jgi:hypothetical protein